MTETKTAGLHRRPRVWTAALQSQEKTTYTRFQKILLGGFLFMVFCLLALKAWTFQNLLHDLIFAIYSIVITTYILSRFGLAHLYRPTHLRPFAERSERLMYEPTVAIIVPAFNELDIETTIRSCVGVDYPKDKLRVIVVDDKSTDDTLGLIEITCSDLMVTDEEAFGTLTVVPMPINQGKRHALATGLDALGPEDGEVIIFIDSDSQVEPDAIRKMVAYFTDERVGAVCGHTDVANRQTNILTRMQAMQYFIAFRIYKSAEALFGAVSCCSGCFSGYRREALDPIVNSWLTQTFLGKPSTFGDDRSLTNYILRHWRVVYAPDAQAYTNVPEHMKQLLKQQLRWKKSWLREAFRASSIMWRKNIVISTLFYLGIMLPLLAPQVVFRAIVVQPYFINELPIWYFGGVAAMATMYGLYYRAHQAEKRWWQGIFFTLFYTTVLVWQLPYAMATIRDSKWGTR